MLLSYDDISAQGQNDSKFSFQLILSFVSVWVEVVLHQDDAFFFFF